MSNTTIPNLPRVLSITGSELIPANQAGTTVAISVNQIGSLFSSLTGSGTVNYVPKFNSSSNLGNSLIFDNGTNVGIGTNLPIAKLSVSGDISSNGNIFINSNDSTYLGYPSTLKVVNPDYNYNYAIIVQNSNISSNYALDIDLDNIGNGYLNAVLPNGKLFNIYSSSVLNLQSGSYIAFFAPNESMRIISSGNVGIGTSSPSAVLQIKAGTNIANTAPLKFTSGTNLTTAEAGAVEYDGTALFSTGTVASGRGVILAPMLVRLNANRFKATNNTSLEAIFDVANDTLVLAANTIYYFKGLYSFTTSATGSPAGIQTGFVFSNTQQDISYKAVSYTTATGTAQTSIYNTVATAVTVTATGTTAISYVVEVEGWFKSNATTGGTIIPAFTQSVAGTSSAPSVLANSWIMIQPMSSNPSATLIAGNWT